MEILGKYFEEGHKEIRSGGVKMRAIRYIATSLLLIFSLPIFAQTNYASLQDAFSKSYAYESRGNFMDAITTMKGIYQ